MDKRTLLIQKMSEAYATAIEFSSNAYAMEQALNIAERFLTTASFDEPAQESVTYGHRAMQQAVSSKHQATLGMIHYWLRNDTSLELRKQISEKDCEKLALRIASLL